MVKCSRSGPRCSVSWICLVRFLSRFAPSVDLSDHAVRCDISAVSARETSAAPDGGAEVDTDTDAPPAGSRLVRVPIDELQEAESR